MSIDRTLMDLPQAPVSADAPAEGIVLTVATAKLPLVIVEPGAQPPGDDAASVLLQLGDLLPDSLGAVVLILGADVWRSEHHTSQHYTLMRTTTGAFS